MKNFQLFPSIFFFALLIEFMRVKSTLYVRKYLSYFNLIKHSHLIISSRKYNNNKDTLKKATKDLN